MNYPVISLFSGAGGLDIGLEQAGLSMALCQELNPVCCNTLRRNGRTVVEGNIQEIQGTALLEAASLRPGEVFLICGGPPCQPFSTAGKKRGLNDPRGSLFRDYIRMIEELQPRFFIMENVEGLKSSFLLDEQGSRTSTSVLDVILQEFERIQYTVSYGLLNAVNYGVPQKRKRFIFIGSRDHESIELPVSTPGVATLRDCIFDLQDVPGPCLQFPESRMKYLRMVPEGGNWRDLPENILDDAMGGARHSGGGKVGFYRRLSWDKPSPTLVTSPIQKATMLCHPTKDRPLSVAEYARIQQFPDHWAFSGTISQQYQQIGNAVPVGLGKAVGEAVLSTAKGGKRSC